MIEGSSVYVTIRRALTCNKKDHFASAQRDLKFVPSLDVFEIYPMHCLEKG